MAGERRDKKRKHQGELPGSATKRVRPVAAQDQTIRVRGGVGASSSQTILPTTQRTLAPPKLHMPAPTPLSLASGIQSEPLISAPEPAEDTAKTEAKQYASGYKPMHQITDTFLGETASDYLDILYELEVPREDAAQCANEQCALEFDHTDRDRAAYTCRQCQTETAYCKTCICALHISSDNPLHHIRRYDGSYWHDDFLVDLGLCIRLGHKDDTPCYGSADTPPSLAILTVMDSFGVQKCRFRFCTCVRASQRQLVPDKRDHQLLRAGFWPATPSRPATVFTLDVLREFYHLTSCSQINARDFCFTKARMTNNAFQDTVDDRYREFLLAFRQYAFLKQLMWAGVEVPGRVDGVQRRLEAGCIAVLCPACPHEHTIDPEWRQTPSEESYIHDFFYGKDGNFQQRQYDKKMDHNDRAYTLNGAYYADEDEFQAWKDVVAKRPEYEKPTHNCNNFKAITGKYEGQLVSGIMSLTCIRHEHIIPNSTVDLSKGEDFASVDFATVHGTRRWMWLNRIFRSFDIECIYGINFLKRMKSFPGAPSQFPLIMRAVPKEHELGHRKSCRARYSFHVLPGSGQTDGEAVERRWSVQNAIAFSARSMGPGYRHDLLNLHNSVYNIQKTFSLGRSLTRRLENAMGEIGVFQSALHDLEATVEARGRPLEAWREREREWMKFISGPEKDTTEGSKRPSPYEPREDNAPTMKAALEALAGPEDDNPTVTDLAAADFDAPDMQSLIYVGLEIQDLQEHTRQHVLEAGNDPTYAQQDSIDQARDDLTSHLHAWQALHAQVLQPIVSAVTSSLGETTEARTQVLPLSVFRQTCSPEQRVLPLPSLYPTRILNHPLFRQSRDVELDLRKAYACDVIREVKHKIALQAVLYKAQKPSWGQAAKTRHGKKMARGSQKVEMLRQRYNTCRRTMLNLGLGPDDANFPDLTRADCNPVVLYHDAEELGSSKKVIPWIWRDGAYREDRSEEADAEWEEEVDRILWFRASAKTMRWTEEVKLLREEIRRTQRFFDSQSNHWAARALLSSVQTRTLRGRAAFAAKQSAMYRGLLQGIQERCQQTGVAELILA